MRNNITYHKEGDYLIPNLIIINDNKNDRTTCKSFI